MAASTSIETQIKAIESAIKKRELSPIYLLMGEETYYIDKITSLFEQKLIDENAKDFNFNIFYGKDSDASQIIAACRQYPLMSDLRLVILKEAQLLDKKEWANMLIYLQAPQEKTILVICFKKETFDKAGGFTVAYKNAIVKQNGVYIECKKITEGRVNSWIKNYLKEKRFTAEENAIVLISEYLGTDLQKIANEIDKMIINIKTTKITTDDVSQYIGISKDYNIFELQNALARKDSEKVLTILNYFEKNAKDNPIQQIIPILFSFFAKLLVASQVKSHNESDIAQAMGISPFFAKNYTMALRYYNSEQLLNIISLFNEYDLKSKGIGASPLSTESALLKELTYKIMHI